MLESIYISTMSQAFLFLSKELYAKILEKKEVTSMMSRLLGRIRVNEVQSQTFCETAGSGICVCVCVSGVMYFSCQSRVHA